jgi:hypothetical protein
MQRTNPSESVNSTYSQLNDLLFKVLCRQKNSGSPLPYMI